MTVVQIGPTPQPKKYSLSAMMKEICARKYHLDLTLICDDGTLSGHKFFLASQSKVEHLFFLLYFNPFIIFF